MKTLIIKKLDNWADNKSQKEFNALLSGIGGAIIIGLGLLSVVIDAL